MASLVGTASAAPDSVLEDLKTIREETKKRLMELNSKRDSIEGELGMLVEVLRSPSCGSVGIAGEGDLVDAEGFPRADIDVYDIRKKRHRVAILQTDHKEIMRVLETELKALHRVLQQIAKSGGAQQLGNEGSAFEGQREVSEEGTSRSNTAAARVNGVNAGTSSDTTESNGSTILSQTIQCTPFARVESVAIASPAEAAGLKVGDAIVSFGGETQTLSNLSAIVQENENCCVAVTVVRGSAQIELSLTPRTWGGRGLLGCYLVPSQSSITVERLYKPPGNPEP